MNPGLPERIAARIHVAESGCWEWTGALTEKGYGKTSFRGQCVRAHRLTYTLLVGLIPHGRELHHDCRNRKCCNPEHLAPVTHAENVRLTVAPTHCPSGHLFDERNTYMRPDGSRKCRSCNQIRESLRRAALRNLKAVQSS